MIPDSGFWEASSVSFAEDLGMRAISLGNGYSDGLRGLW
jgi:hypothetical protein